MFSPRPDGGNRAARKPIGRGMRLGRDRCGADVFGGLDPDSRGAGRGAVRERHPAGEIGAAQHVGSPVPQAFQQVTGRRLIYVPGRGDAATT
jgi:hypothetical protein